MRPGIPAVGCWPSAASRAWPRPSTRTWPSVMWSADVDFSDPAWPALVRHLQISTQRQGIRFGIRHDACPRATARPSPEQSTPTSRRRPHADARLLRAVRSPDRERPCPRNSVRTDAKRGANINRRNGQPRAYSARETPAGHLCPRYERRQRTVRRPARRIVPSTACLAPRARR